MSAPSSEAAGLSLLTRAKSKEAVASFLHACFRHRHDGVSAGAPASSARLAAAPAVAELGFAEGEAAPRHALCAAGVALVRRALYESAEARGAEQLAPLLPAGLEPRLGALLGGVLAAALSGWREAAVEQRVGLPRLQKVGWAVQSLCASSELAAAAEPVVTLTLTVSDDSGLEGARGAGGYGALGGGGGGGGGGEEAMPASRAFAVTLNQASLASLVASLRKVKESLSAL
jgi:hypothetical protein